MNPPEMNQNPAQLLTRALAVHKAGNLKEALSLYLDVLEQDPNHGDALHLAGLIFDAQDSPAQAKSYLRKAVDAHPGNILFSIDLARFYIKYQQTESALSMLERFSPGQVNDTSVLLQLAQCYRSLEKWDAVCTLLNKATSLSAGSFEVWNNYGATCFKLRKWREAIRAFTRALEVQPGRAEAYNNLGLAYDQQGDSRESIDAFTRACSLKPDLYPAQLNLGKHLLTQGNVSGAIERFTCIPPADRNYSVAQSNLLIALNYDPDISVQKLAQAHREVGTSLRPNAIPRPKRSALLHNKLRVGIISPDLYHHPVSFFLLPLVRNYDRKEIELVIFSDVASPDRLTGVINSMVDEWETTTGRDTEQISELIQQKRLDMLIDVTGHLAGNRLAAFAHKPAPVQLSYLGYPHSTGLETIDYYLTDATCDPDGYEPFYAETLLRLDGCFCCYEPLPDAPPVAEPPCLVNRHVTFGSLHHLARINPRMIALWARLLNELPTARLVIFRTNLLPHTADRIRMEFNEHGIDSERLTLTNTAGAGKHYLSVYDAIDIALDTLPWSGHTTACEALWMGIPVISRPGRRHAGRMVASVLKAAGLSPLIAQNDNGYIEIARKLASEPQSLRSHRKHQRKHLQNSQLLDGAGFAGRFTYALQKAAASIA
ncbi:MAG: tetratricopeptide repeat protein [Chitinivibrionales bacterium]|nr:tetratricopeptide repeat protein [Chitinivibrionales bacterium]